MSSPTFPAGPSNGQAHSEFGITWNYNSGTGLWESAIGENTTVVTKNKLQQYTFGAISLTDVASKLSHQLLSIEEVDSNIVNLKQAILDSEFEFQRIHKSTSINLNAAISRVFTLEKQLGGTAAPGANESTSLAALTTSTKTNLIAAINTLAPKAGPSFTTNGNIPASFDHFPDLPAQSSKSILSRNTVAPSNSPIFTGSPSMTTNPILTDESTKIATTQYTALKIRDELQNTSVSIVPESANVVLDLGASGKEFNDIYIKGDILPKTDQQNIGSATQPFGTIFANTGRLAINTLFIGDDSISGNVNGGVNLPDGTSIGDAENVISSGIFSTVLDEKISKATGYNKLRGTFSSAGTVISARTPVCLDSNGELVDVVSGNLNSFIGFTEARIESNGSGFVIVHGPVTGFSNLTANAVYHITTGGILTETASSTTKKIGIATSTTELFLFSTPIDPYILNRDKVSLSDFSISTLAASSNGGLSYNATTGVFSFTPPDLGIFAEKASPTFTGTPTAPTASVGDNPSTQIATTAYVTSKIAATAPSQHNAQLTGTPTAPTAGTSEESTQIATTAYVANKIAATPLNTLSDVVINNPLNGHGIVFNSTTSRFENGLVGGGGAGVDFIVDGGTATQASTSIQIILDGGSA